jgi:hypothetical protein
MLNCQSCGFSSPDNNRFCRQCGAPLLSESAQLDPPTRNYGHPAGSAPLPPSIADAVAGETARYQYPLQATPAYAPPYNIPPAPNTTSLKSKRRRFLKWGAFLLALLFSGGIGAAINEEANDNLVALSTEDRARLERLRAEDQLRQTMNSSITDIQNRVRDDLNRRLDDVARARDDAQRALERGDWSATGEKPLDLSGYEYQGATTGQYSRIPGKEMLTQRTKDDFDLVVQFYRQKLGQPYLISNERNQKQAIFQSTGTPSVTIMVRESRDRSRQPEITILRSPFRFPPIQPEIIAPPDPPKPPADAKPVGGVSGGVR